MKIVIILCLFTVALAYADVLPPLPTDGSCEPGKSYKQDCNTCVCGLDGKATCTFQLCGGFRKKRYSDLPTRPPKGYCIPGIAYRLFCVCPESEQIQDCTLPRERDRRSLRTDCVVPPRPPTGHCTPGLAYRTECICPSTRRLQDCVYGEKNKAGKNTQNSISTETTTMI